jgi:YesN/AraC family two-component response regulator
MGEIHMNSKGNILIADDEEVFLQSTADLFRKRGYDCTCAGDAVSAEKLLRENNYDLLISDIRMPGNINLELIRDIPSIVKGLPIIIVTGFPTLDTAIKSIGLPVVAYLLKPFEFKDLFESAIVALEHSSTHRIALTAQEHLKKWNEELARLIEMIESNKGDLSQISIETYLNITLGNVMNGLNDIKNITEAIAAPKNIAYTCDLLNCPRDKAFREIIAETINAIKNTKRAFKSNELRDLRVKLELLLEKDFGSN